MPRLFTAIPLPDDIAAELARLRMPLPGARWIEPRNYHITLRFGGDMNAERAREFVANLAALEPDGFEVRLMGVGAFGGNDPHLVWAGVEPSAALDALQRAHEKAARAAGLAPEKRPFKPHVTLARLRHGNPDAVARFLSRAGAYRSEPIFVTHTVLMSSRASVGGGPYAIEDRFPMRGLGGVMDDDDDDAADDSAARW